MNRSVGNVWTCFAGNGIWEHVLPAEECVQLVDVTAGCENAERFRLRFSAFITWNEITVQYRNSDWTMPWYNGNCDGSSEQYATRYEVSGMQYADGGG